MNNDVCGCENGERNICSRFLKGGSSSLYGDKNTRARQEDSGWLHGSDAL